MNEYILITGGAGFIGSNLCESLLQKSKNIIVLDNFNDYYDPKIKQQNVDDLKVYSKDNNFKIIYGDIRDDIILEDIFNEYSINKVIHLAAYAGVRPSLEDPVIYSDVNITGTINLLEKCKKYGVSKFIFASSSSVYGNNPIPFNEEQLINSPLSFYALTKATGEQICKIYHDLYGINIVCLRFFTVYGPKQRPDLAIHKFIHRITMGEEIEIFGDGSTARDYTYIDDIVHGICQSSDLLDIETRYFETINLGNSKIITLLELVNQIATCIGVEPKIVYKDNQLGDMIITNADISKACTILKYEPQTSLEEGLKKFYEWFKSHKGELHEL
jgi:UDP-glucuronate 4-epimerase